MPRALSQLRDTLLVACLAALSCLPPSGWQLCVGANGHWAIEPSSIAGDACCDEAPAGAATGAAAADDCADCTDYALAGGAALGARAGDDASDDAVDAPCVTPDGALALPPLAFACPVADAASRPPAASAPLRTTFLRC